MHIIDLEWRLVYVGSAENEKLDQILYSLLVGPVEVGMSKFVLECDPPDPSKIPGNHFLNHLHCRLKIKNGLIDL